MKILTAFTNRLGNRSSNQDRCLVLEKADRALLVVADGMGGHARGDLAAQVVVDSLRRSFSLHRGTIEDPRNFLKGALETAHLEVVDAGRKQRPSVDPRTTCVACLVQGDHAWWAHVGDSRLYLLRAKRLVTRTRDHTPIEELLQKGAINEDELRTHPLRNSVSRCLGGARKLPRISFGDAGLKPEDTLLLCSDGLWSAIPEQKLVDIPWLGDLERAVNTLTDNAQMASYPHSDNISLVALRWLSADKAGETAPRKTSNHGTAEPRKKEKDPVQQAIDDIHRAMLEYASEMKK